MGDDLRAQVRNVAFQPREPVTFETPFGPATMCIGAGFDQVVVTLTAPAADELARVIASSRRLDPDPAGQPAEADPSAWFGAVVDLLAAAALCNPEAYRAAKLAPLEGTAR